MRHYIEYADSPCAFVYIIVTYNDGVEILTKLIGKYFTVITPMFEESTTLNFDL